jgi:hypothetical protein
MLAVRTVSIQGMPGRLHVTGCELEIFLNAIYHTTTALEEGEERERGERYRGKKRGRVRIGKEERVRGKCEMKIRM